MQNSGDAGLSERVADMWPELAEQSKEKTAHIAELRAMLTPETLGEANASAGRLLFSQSCANCHTLFGEGKKIAPDLTGAQRSNLNYLLENIVDPSATVSKNFQLSIVLLDDGRVLNGVVVGRTEKTLTLQTATDQVVVQRDEIDEMKRVTRIDDARQTAERTQRSADSGSDCLSDVTHPSAASRRQISLKMKAGPRRAPKRALARCTREVWRRQNSASEAGP